MKSPDAACPQSIRRVCGKGGPDMARAEEIFTEATKTVEDRHRIYGKARYITIGYLDERMVILVWTRRQRSQRVISMRKANGREQARYVPDIRR